MTDILQSRSCVCRLSDTGPKISLVLQFTHETDPDLDHLDDVDNEDSCVCRARDAGPKFALSTV